MSTPEQSLTIHDWVWLMLDNTDCCGCGRQPNLLWAWEGVSADIQNMEQANAAADAFAQKAVPHLRALGWEMIGNGIYCPECIAARRYSN